MIVTSFHSKKQINKPFHSFDLENTHSYHSNQQQHIYFQLYKLKILFYHQALLSKLPFESSSKTL